MAESENSQPILKQENLPILSANTTEQEQTAPYSYTTALAQQIPADVHAKAWAKQLNLLLIHPAQLNNWPEHQPDAQMISAALKSGIFRFENTIDGTRILVSTDIPTLPAIAEAAAKQKKAKEKIYLSTPQNYVDFIYDHYGRPWVQAAAAQLSEKSPQYSALFATRRGVVFGLGIMAICCAMCIFAYTSLPILQILAAGVSAFFILGALMRLEAIWTMAINTPEHEPIPLPDPALPIYSILVPCYLEGNVIPQLISALNALDYPREKLDIKFILEADDHETRTALAEHVLPPHFEIITLPDIGPRTKPKALMAAMPRVKGSMVTIYDAEDIPEPSQLRRIAAHMHMQGERCGCLQAQLTVNARGYGFLQHHFALEYATWFELLLPGFAAHHLPIPLGGTSNHFRTSALEKIGGWDPYNVTEDADLGLRLARFGYSVLVVNSRTYEEAAPTLKDWVNQRTRWMKGWYQTLAVHFAQPLTLMNELGIRRAASVALIPGGSLVGAMMFPVSLVLVGLQMLLPHQFSTLNQWDAILKMLMQFTFIFGLFVPLCANALMAIRRKNTLWLFMVPSIPIYWLFTSYAAWRALWELWRWPFHWHKTPHLGVR